MTETTTPVAAASSRPAPARSTKRRRRMGEPISRRAYLAIAASTFVVIGLLWWGITAAGLVKPLFLPSPSAVWTAFTEQVSNGQLWTDAGASVYRIMIGFLLATLMSLPIGILMGTSAKAEAALEPLVDFIRYMPVVAFVPLTILWVGIDDPQKFFIVWMGTFFQQVLMVADDVRRVPRSLIDLGETLGLSNGQILRKIVLRSAAPKLWDTLRITLGWAWTWLVVAELVAATSGLGYRITLAQRYLATDLIIAYVIVLGILGLVLDQLLRLAGRRMFHYEKGVR